MRIKLRARIDLPATKGAKLTFPIVSTAPCTVYRPAAHVLCIPISLYVRLRGGGVHGGTIRANGSPFLWCCWLEEEEEEGDIDSPLLLPL